MTAVTDRHDVTIVSDGDVLRGWHYRPGARAGRAAPVVVMAHGLSAVKELGLDRYAAAVNDAGFHVVVFDHPCFGASGGTPRQEVDPERQLRAYRDAITWAAGQDGVDDTRVGVWGSSLGGGHAVVLAATDDRVGAAVAQVPYLGAPGSGVPPELARVIADDDEAQRRGADPLTIPVVTEGPDGGGLLSPDPDGHPWFTGQDAPTWRNEVTIRSVARILEYRPSDVAAEVRAPVLLLVASDDVLAPATTAHDALARMPPTCALVELPGGHFDVYDAWYERSRDAAVGWFRRWLGHAPA